MVWLPERRSDFRNMDGNGNDGGSACQTGADRPHVVSGALGKGGNEHHAENPDLELDDEEAHSLQSMF
jgi:hypothetical protein